MKKYKVNVNGKTYEVLVEAVEEVSGNIKVENKEAAPQTNTQSAKNVILAPISGKVLDVKVKVGSVVNKGDTVLIIEAMKLENEVKSPYSGKVKEIITSKGSSVNNKDELIVLE